MILQLAFCQRLETKGINAYYPCCWTRTKTYMERIEVVDSPKSSKTGKQHNHSQISTVGNWKSCFLPHHFAISKHSLGDFPFPTVEFFFGRGPPPVVFVCIHLALKPQRHLKVLCGTLLPRQNQQALSTSFLFPQVSESFLFKQWP